MGVPGLWDLIRPAAARTSLSTLARDAFKANRNGLRALTIGIDASYVHPNSSAAQLTRDSIWIFHAQIPVHGENPFLRTIFYKITTLLQQPVLPVFVFDGPNKPSQKRNQTVAGHFGTADFRSRQFKALLDVCGLEWWNAPGEAEAELAVMNRQGKIDAVMSDDVDALLFGATCLLRNNSPTLSGAQASTTQSNTSRADLRHYEVFRSTAIRELWAAKEGTRLVSEEDCRMAMVLIALLGGGDYAPEGLTGFGPTITSALAHAGLSDFLKLYTTDSIAFKTELSFMHGRMIDELRSNSTKQIGRKYPQRAAELAARDPSSLFPAFALDAYLRPCTSPLRDPTQGWPGFGRGVETLKRGRARHDGRGDLEGMAKACEKYFEWGTRDLVSRKFAGESVGLFGAEVMNEARERVRRATARRPMSPVLSGPSSQAESLSMITSFFSSALPIRAFSKSSPPAPSQPQHISLHIVKIHSIRDDPTNPELREYRISFRNDAYVARCQDAMEGSRVDPRDLPLADRQALGLVDRLDGDDDVGLPAIQTSGSTSAKSEIRVWVSEYLVLEGFPELVEAYEEELLTKATKKVRAPKKTSARPRPTRRAKVAVGEKSGAFVEFFTQRPIESSSIEEVEEVEERRPARRSNSVIDLSLSPSPRPARQKSPSLPELAGRLTRPCPTSSLSSVGSEHPHRDLLKPSRVVASSSSPVPQSRAKSKAKALRIMSPASSPLPRLVRAVSTVSGASASSRGKKDEPIDLCSSEDEPPRPPSDKSQIWRTPPSSPPSNRSSKLQTAGARGSWKVKTAATDTAQRRLDLPVVSATTTRVVAHGKGRFVDDPVWAI